jgi:Fe-S cluster assembly protein SufD
MTAAAERTNTWAGRFAARKPQAAWIEQLRESGFARFSALGFPTVREEDWRFTNVARIAKTSFESAPTIMADADALVPFTKGIRLVFVNGQLQSPAPNLQGVLTTGVWNGDAREYLGLHASIETNAFVALNTAFLGEGAYVHIASEAVITEPIHLVYISISVPGATPAASHPRALIVAGERARCTVVETYVGTGSYLSNAVTEIVLEAGANVDHYKVQMESPQAFHVATLQAQAGFGAHYSTTCISLGGALVRNNSNVVLSEGSEAVLNGLYLAKDKQHVDNQLTVDHAHPNASSHELYKGVLDDKATAAFNGKILVRKDAQKTDAKQTNNNLLLSDDAVINTKPELQILADDVRCTHGATIGQLDSEAIFYLQSRGIGKEEAKSLLTCAFAQDLIDRIRIPALRTALEQIVFERLYASCQ